MTEPSKLLIIWTSGDREAALRMVFMYTLNARKHNWWEEVALVVWGPSAKLLVADEELQQAVAKMRAEGVELLACKAAAKMYGLVEQLEELGVNVTYMGEPLTKMLKSGWVVLTF